MEDINDFKMCPEGHCYEGTYCPYCAGERQPVRLYDFVYSIIPQWAVRVRKGDLPIQALLSKEWILETALDNSLLLDGFEVGNTSSTTADDGIFMVLYIFPEPKDIPDAKFALLAFDIKDEYIRYFTLEKSLADSWVLGGIDMPSLLNEEKWRHLNFGNVSYEPTWPNFVNNIFEEVMKDNPKFKESFEEVKRISKAKAEAEAEAKAEAKAEAEQENDETEQTDDYWAEWFAQAEAGDADAQVIVGNRLCNPTGEDGEADYAGAMYWFKKAAEQGDAIAQATIGVLYSNGLGVEQNSALAAEWYEKAVAQGIPEAQDALANLYIDGDGVEKNLVRGAELFRLAAEQGVAVSQNNLGWCYEHGNGVEQNYVQAVICYKKAARQGNETAQEHIKTIKAMSLPALNDLFSNSLMGKFDEILGILYQDESAMLPRFATDENIERCRKDLEELGLEPMPDDYIDFLKQINGLAWNGIEFYGTDVVSEDDSGYQLLDIVTGSDAGKERYDERINAECLYIGRADEEIYVWNAEDERYEARDLTDVTDVYEAFDTFVEMFVAIVGGRLGIQGARKEEDDDEDDEPLDEDGRHDAWV
jgi:TPR repeat protein